MIHEHIIPRVIRSEADAWLVDGFGAAHPVAATRTRIGRRQDADLVVLHGSVSRDHAELHRATDGWQVRDLGSRNGTRVDGQRIQSRAPLVDGNRLQLGDVAMLFVSRMVALPPSEPRANATTHAARAAALRFTLHGPAVDLCLLCSADAEAVDVGGALLHRASGSAAWAERSLPPLEFQLLRLLSRRAVEEAGSPSQSRGCVPTKQLARQLPFQSKYANEENVRQVVRRLRSTLDELGAAGLIEGLPGRGYYVTWSVQAS